MELATWWPTQYKILGLSWINEGLMRSNVTARFMATHYERWLSLTTCREWGEKLATVAPKAKMSVSVSVCNNNNNTNNTMNKEREGVVYFFHWAGAWLRDLVTTTSALATLLTSFADGLGGSRPGGLLEVARQRLKLRTPPLFSQPSEALNSDSSFWGFSNV